MTPPKLEEILRFGHAPWRTSYRNAERVGLATLSTRSYCDRRTTADENGQHMNTIRTRLAPFAATIAVGVLVAVMAAPLKWI